MRILVAEDERISRQSLVRQLGKWGHGTVATEDGQKALAAWQTEPFEIVISDWDMPEMDGPSLIRRIRESKRDAYTYIILLTARSTKEDLIEGMEAGADDFLTKPFDQNELRVRLRAAQRMLDLERSLAAQNHELGLANQRMKRDLEAAARVQQAFLPQTAPRAAHVRFAWRLEPCDELAGDALNLFDLDDRYVVVYLLDVSGHGVSASLLSVSVTRVLSPSDDPASVIRSKDGPDGYAQPAEIAARLNRLFPMEKNGGHYFTLHYGILDTRTGQYTFTSAGHPGPILVTREGAAEILDLPDLPIGVVDAGVWDQRTLQLVPGSRLYIHSDGLNEERDAAGELFGRDRLTQCMARNRGVALDVAADRVLTEIREWPGTPRFSDDASLVVMEFLGD
jgi:phosphoserine phosphatase RsbU/P